MTKVKKVKISATKRAQHLKSKKKNAKQLLNQKKAPKPSDLKPVKPGKNLFGTQKRTKDKSKNKRSGKDGKPKRFIENQNSDDEQNNEEIVDNIMDCLDENEYNDFGENLEKKKSRKRKYQQDVQIDDESKLIEKLYTNESIQLNSEKKLEIGLLPFKSRDGEIISRTTKVDYKKRIKNVNEEKVEDENENKSEEEDDDESDVEDSDDDIVQNDLLEINETTKSKKIISTTDLLILRQQEIERQKYRIGIICSGILEKPEDKMKHFSALFELMEEYSDNGSPNLLTVRKIACISIAEIFKDILPEYRVGQVDPKMTTIRKATLERVTYENTLLLHFKKYLQKLEKITGYISKKGGTKTKQHIKMCEVAVECLCDLLSSHPYFNYVQNVAQLLVYMLNCNYPTMRKSVNQCFRNLFKTDQRYDMTLYVVRRINHLIKTKSNNVHLDLITCLMSLKIKNVNLDAEKENELKQKKLENHRQRLLSLSKKEKKRRKRLVELNRELQETKAEENKKSKHYKLTEIIKMVFTIFFRILKNDPNSKLLSACLEGLAEFAHVINLEFFSDLIEVLNNLLESNELGYREELHCIQTIFIILSGQGQVLNIDPIRFYGHLYRNLLVVNAGKNHQDFLIILHTLNEVLIKRRKNITQQRLMAFIKRILIVSLNLLHNGTLGSLGIIKNVMQLTSTLDIILDTDTSVGSGRYDPELEDPEYSNAGCSALYELSILQRHYHPTVRKIALNIAHGVPASGEGSLPSEIGKLTAKELFEKFDSSQMAFNPPIQIPNKNEPKIKKDSQFLDDELMLFCKETVNQNSIKKNDLINFYAEYQKNLQKMQC